MGTGLLFGREIAAVVCKAVTGTVVKQVPVSCELKSAEVSHRTVPRILSLPIWSSTNRLELRFTNLSCLIVTRLRVKILTGYIHLKGMPDLF